MKAKQVLAIVLLVFVVGSLAYMIGKGHKTGSSQNSDDPATNPPARPVASGEPSIVEQNASDSSTNAAATSPQNTQLIVYYFHGDMRCPTCHKLETFAKEALDSHFADEIASRKIVWKVVNVDRSQNSHFVQDYKLVSKAIVLSEVADGKEVTWTNLDQIWQKVGDKDSYVKYIRQSVLEGLEGKGS